MALYAKDFLNQKLLKACTVKFDEGMLPTEDVSVAEEIFFDLTGGQVQELRKSKDGSLWAQDLWYVRVDIDGMVIVTYTIDPAYTLADWAYRFAERPL